MNAYHKALNIRRREKQLEERISDIKIVLLRGCDPLLAVKLRRDIAEIKQELSAIGEEKEAINY